MIGSIECFKATVLNLGDINLDYRKVPAMTEKK